MSEKGNADRSSEQSSEQCSEDSRVKSPEDRSETVPYTREQWESLPTDPDPEINLGYDYMDWEEFETAAMAGRLAVTQEESQYQQLVDTLTWTNNQILARWATTPLARTELMNDHTWNFADADEYPELHRRLTFRQMTDGSLQYVPEEER